MAEPAPARPRSKLTVVAILVGSLVLIGVLIAIVVAVVADDDSPDEGDTPTVVSGPVPEGEATLEVTEECNVDDAGIARIAGTLVNRSDETHSYEVPVVVSAGGEELGDAEAYVPEVEPGDTAEWVNTVPLGADGPTDVECELGAVQYAR